MLKRILEDDDAVGMICTTCSLVCGIEVSICSAAVSMCLNGANAVIGTTGICAGTLVNILMATVEMGKQLIAELTTGK